MPHGKVTVLKANCPDCNELIRPITTPRLGTILICPQCEAELEVTAINPLELEWAIDDDDWDDDDWDDDDDD